MLCNAVYILEEGPDRAQLEAEFALPYSKDQVKRTRTKKRIIKAWFLYEMVAQNILRMYNVKKVFSEKKSDLTTLSM